MVNVVVGLQLGDEGKGRVTDYLSEHASIVARVQGGNNAGHTITIKDKVYKLHHIPCGVLRGTKSLLCAGMVIDPDILISELENLEQSGIDTSNIYIDGSAHVILDLYKNIDSIQENNRGVSIGTTKRGIGPAYSTKYARYGIRFWDLISNNSIILRNKLKNIVNLFNLDDFVVDVYMEKLTSKKYLSRFSKMVCETHLILKDALAKDEQIFIEGAQGTFLDIDYGMYPFVTSSCTTSAGTFLGTRLNYKDINMVYGVVKAYTTYVGNGYFPAEQDCPSQYLLDKGKEYGTTTGRARRCGWLDLPMLKSSIAINGVTKLVLTKLDVLSGLDQISYVDSYSLDGKVIDYYPSDPYAFSRVKPVIKSMPGWKEDLSSYNYYYSLPTATKNFCNLIERKVNTPISIISIGPEREQLIRYNL